MHTDVVAWAREAFDLGDGDVSVTPGARGALGQVWRLAAGHRVYALKQVFAGAPPTPAEVDAEVAFAQRAATAGVRLPASHPDRTGRYLVPLPDGGWLRLYDWVDLRSADLIADAEALGVLLARLHRCGPPADREPGGAPPDRWYQVPPDRDGWTPLVTAATEVGTSWSSRLATAVDALPGLYAILCPADPAAMRLCHRDLHPGNVLVDEAGALVVVDWDDLGPAEPARELASTLMTCFHDGNPEFASMRRAYQSYVEAGGPARLRSAADFTVLITTQLNFLNLQVRVALDPKTLPRDRDWAELEIDEGLRILPTPDLVAAVLDAVEASPLGSMSDHAWVNEASGVEHEQLPSEANDIGPFFHGTKADLQPGDLLEPGHGSNFGERARANYIYLTASLDAATWGAELALGEGPGRIYRVEPIGPFEDDPNLTNKRFPGNPTRSYRTREPLLVVGEVVDWEPHPPQVLQDMQDRLEELKRLGIEAIND